MNLSPEQFWVACGIIVTLDHQYMEAFRRRGKNISFGCIWKQNNCYEVFMQWRYWVLKSHLFQWILFCGQWRGKNTFLILFDLCHESHTWCKDHIPNQEDHKQSEISCSFVFKCSATSSHQQISPTLIWNQLASENVIIKMNITINLIKESWLVLSSVSCKKKGAALKCVS